MANEKELVDSHSLTMSQDSELNAKAAADEGFVERMAFETYYKLGDNRTLKKIATSLSKGSATIERWSKKYRWPQRVKERERQAAEYLLMQQSAQEEAETKKKHLTLIDAAISTFSKKLVEGGVKLDSVDDLQKLVNMRWKLANMPDKRVNPTAVRGGASIDLRLSGMEKTELQSFLYSTLKSIERVMNRPKYGNSKQESEDIMDLDISLRKNSKVIEAPQTKVIEAESEEIEIFDDLDIDGSLDLE